MRRLLPGLVPALLPGVLAAALLSPTPTGAATPAGSRADTPATARATTFTLGGVTVRAGDATTQVVTVNRSRGYRAVVTWWVRTDAGWAGRATTRNGRIGYGGLVKPQRRRQGTGTTPLGTHRLISSFGTHAARATWSLPYRTIRKGDYWVQDNASDHYNRYRNKAAGGFRWWLPSSHANSSERLKDYPTQYEFSVVTSFNYGQVRHRGSGIFLHVNGPGATGGCVSVPRSMMVRLMRELDPAARPVIAIGR